MPFEEQFWEQFDAVFDLSEDSMMKELPFFVTDPGQLEKLEELLKNNRAVPEEVTRKLA